jgi:hypothetical protein
VSHGHSHPAEFDPAEAAQPLWPSSSHFLPNGLWLFSPGTRSRRPGGLVAREGDDILRR